MTARNLLLALTVGLAPAPLLAALDEPAASPFRSAFEAQFPKSEATAAASELAQIAAFLGIDLTPAWELVEQYPEPTSEESGDPKPIAQATGVDRPRGPPEEAVAAFQAISGPIRQFLDRELKSTEERVGAVTPQLERYFTDHAERLAAIDSLLLRDEAVRWPMDVTAKKGRPSPNLRGLMQLQRLLVVRSLLQIRRGEADSALRTLEAAWRLNEALSERPEMICHLIVVAAAKLQVGALRKLEGPAPGWVERLRDRTQSHRYLAALRNEIWQVTEADQLEGDEAAYARVLRQVTREYAEADPCSWTTANLEEPWDRAFRENFAEGDLFAEVVSQHLAEGFARWCRYLVDAELTALILDARAERAASPRRAWPDKLLTLGSGVCSNERWSYRPSDDGTAVFAFEGRVVDTSSEAALRLPLTFIAGVPLATVRRSRPKTESGFVRGAEGIRLFYRKIIDGPSVAVLLHGGPGSNMNAVWPDLQSLGKGRTVVMYDQRGGGRSQILKDPVRLTAQHHVRDLEALRRALRLERFTLIGESWGALLATLYASEHPTRVERLLLIGPAPPTRAIMERRLDESDQTMGLRKQLAEIAGAMPGAPNPAVLCREFFGLYMKQFFVRPENISLRRGSSCDAPADGVRNYFVVNQATLASLGDYDLRPVLARLTVPAMVIEGASSIPSTVESAKVFAQSLAGATLVLVPEAGHFPQVERPDLFFPAVEKFLSEAVRDGEKRP